MLKSKFAAFITAFLLLAFVPIQAAIAHSVLEKSTPANGKKLEKPIKNIKLKFNTKIEKGSTLYLVSDGGKKLQPATVKITDDRLKASFQESLTPGTYQVKWEVVGADGHLVKNQYSFTIQKDESKQSSDREQSSNAQDKNKQDAEEQNSSEQTKDDDKQQSFFENGIIVILVIAGIVLIAWMFFSKRNE